MKIHCDFVTNSSSESYVMVGISDKELIKELLSINQIIYSELDTVELPSNWDDIPDYLYLKNTENLLDKDHTISELRKMFVDICKSKFGKDIPAEKVCFMHTGFYNG